MLGKMKAGWARNEWNCCDRIEHSVPLKQQQQQQQFIVIVPVQRFCFPISSTISVVRTLQFIFLSCWWLFLFQLSECWIPSTTFRKHTITTSSLTARTFVKSITTSTTTTTRTTRATTIPRIVLQSSDNNSSNDSGSNGDSSSSSIPIQDIDKDEADENSQDVVVSDIDARVLQSMLREQKLDLTTEDDVRKLLDRATILKTPTTTSTSTTSDNTNASNEKGSQELVYMSQMLQTLAETKLWQKLSMQTQGFAESVGIWVSNKIENDVQVLAALGMVVWDKAVRDVARALPAATNRPTNTNSPFFLLNNSSSYTTMQQQQRQSRNQWNRPIDEIEQFSNQVVSILSGQQVQKSTSTLGQSNRGLRSVAPAGGGVYRTERQLRAYRRVQQQQQQNQPTSINVVKKVMDGTVGIMDTAYEIRREFQIESNRPGYKSVSARRAIEAAIQTNFVLQGTKVDMQLTNAAQKQLQWQSKSDGNTMNSIPVNELILDENKEKVDKTGTTESTIPSLQPNQIQSPIDLLPFMESSFDTLKQQQQQQEILWHELHHERWRMLQRLQKCIDAPNTTWLQPSVINTIEDVDILQGTGMQEIITEMILLKNALRQQQQQNHNSTTYTGDSIKMVVSAMIQWRDRMEQLCCNVSTNLSSGLAYQLRLEVFQEDPKVYFAETSIWWRLEQVLEEQYLGASMHNNNSNSNINDIAEDEGETTEYELVTPTIPTQGTSTTNPTAESIYRATAVPNSTIDARYTTNDMAKESQFVDVDIIMEDSMKRTKSNSVAIPTTIDAIDDGDSNDFGIGLRTEIVTDEDFDRAFGEVKVASSGDHDDNDQENINEKDSIVNQVLLRSLDVTFFILEKVIASVPGTLSLFQTVILRIAEANRDGRGTKGWKPVKNVANAKGRY